MNASTSPAKVALVVVALAGLVSAAGISLFATFADETGRLRTISSSPSTLNARNEFFKPSIGTNGQACVTCHQPDQGMTIVPGRIRKAFVFTRGRDPLFRLNDTADRPDADTSTLFDRIKAYRLFLTLGVVRIGKNFPATTNFTVEPQDTRQFGVLPSTTDPQRPGVATLSLFRRPLISTNVNFDSSVLWDGRANIADMPGQVRGAIQTLLLGPGTDSTTNQNIANFMTGIYTDQVFDREAGDLAARGATGGVRNLLALAQSPNRPCVRDAAGSLTPFVAAVATTSTCTQVVVNNPATMSLFDAWANLPDKNRNGDHEDESRNEDRAAVARGQVVYNTVDLHVTGGSGGPIGKCVTCHATNNIGNHPDATFFRRLGTDSLDILTKLRDGTFAPGNPPHPELQSLIDRVEQLPRYCLRPTSDPNSFSTSACGQDAGDVKTADPGRAMVTGDIADVGKFKPPTLRDLPVRAPFFHNGSAATLDDVINFYDARFNIGLTKQQHDDLKAFLRSL